MRCARNFFLAAICVAFLFSAASRADQVFLHPSADATLYGVNPLNSAGGWAAFIAGTTQNRTTNRALLQFDVASLVPAGATINDVNLMVEVTKQPGCGLNSEPFGLHRVLRSWGEGTTVPPSDTQGGQGAPADPGDATWLYAHAFSDPWGIPGGAAGTDYVPDISSQASISGLDVYQFEATGQMVGDVQYWLDHPLSNFGWMLKGETENLAFTARRFASREEASGGPVLQIDFTPVPEPSTLAIGAIAALLALFQARTGKWLPAKFRKQQ